MLGNGRGYLDEFVTQDVASDWYLLAEVFLTLVCEDSLVHIELLIKDAILVLSPLKQAHLRTPDHFDHVVMLSLRFNELLQYAVMRFGPVVDEVDEFLPVEQLVHSLLFLPALD